MRTYARGMTQHRGPRPGYDWDGASAPAEPAPVDLPDRRESEPVGPGDLGDSLFAGPEGVPGASAESGPVKHPGRRFTPWSILAIVALQAVVTVAVAALVVGGVLSLLRGDPAPAPDAAPPATQAPTDEQTPRTKEPGTVTDAQGKELTDGTGGYDHPGDVGEHTFGWAVWTEGTLSVSAREVDLEATLPRAGEDGLLEDGFQLVEVTYEARYDGPGQFAPVEELWLAGETDRTYFHDVAEGLLPDTLRAVKPLSDGESAEFRALYVVPSQEIDEFRLGVETYSGEVLYYGVA